ncbi:ABC transporter substrate-binding protein [Inediibacterium massiliense]|uniref:ABC transporter substrate-binding protein n=1 Tax=Inediibacterium massiliense TaxID=1658111 RepID=UPI0006B5B921|nr:ABC transporter substrate-binding protein [Inediibacterium massiliense]
MVGKNLLKKVAVFLVGLVFLVGCSEQTTSDNQEKMIQVGISQIIEHPALDAARKGFEDALEEEFSGKINIDFQNAQGDIPTAQAIAQNFVSQKKDMIFAIATPAVQAAFNATKEIPIVMAAVTDPVEAELVKSLEKPGTNVTGTIDMAPMNKQFQLLKTIVPNAKKVGILYNTSEINSEIQMKMAKNEAKKLGLEVIASGVTNVNEVSQALSILSKDIDVLYTPTDNLVASSMTLITEECTKKGIPVIGAEEAHVKGGALATEGIDYYKSGFEAGKIASEILKGKDPKEIPIGLPKDTQLVINMDTAKKLNIQIPKELESKAEMIGSGE